MVACADDIRVAGMEDYPLEHALCSLGISKKLLIFPGEGHPLAKNSWHGKVKVREELKWLEKYGDVASMTNSSLDQSQNNLAFSYIASVKIPSQEWHLLCLALL
jgi:hypothetical protein